MIVHFYSNIKLNFSGNVQRMPMARGTGKPCYANSNVL